MIYDSASSRGGAAGQHGDPPAPSRRWRCCPAWRSRRADLAAAGQVLEWMAWPFSAYTISHFVHICPAPNDAVGAGRDRAPPSGGNLYARCWSVGGAGPKRQTRRQAWWGIAGRAGDWPVGGLLVTGGGEGCSVRFVLPPAHALPAARDGARRRLEGPNTTGQGEDGAIQAPGGRNGAVDGGPGP